MAKNSLGAKNILRYLFITCFVMAISFCIVMLPKQVQPVFAWDHTFALKINFVDFEGNAKECSIEVESNCCKETDWLYVGVTVIHRNCYAYLTLKQIKAYLKGEYQSYFYSDDGTGNFDADKRYVNIKAITGDVDIFKTIFGNGSGTTFTGAYCYNGNTNYDGSNDYKKQHLYAGETITSEDEYIGFSTWTGNGDGKIFVSYTDSLGISFKTGEKNATTPSLSYGTFSNNTALQSAHLTNKYDLTQLAQNVNRGYNYNDCSFYLDNDIDLGGMSWTPIGQLSIPFCGKFYGRNHSITNFVSQTTSMYEFAGLFGYVLNGNISNVAVDNATISNPYYAAAIVGCVSGNNNIYGCKVGKDVEISNAIISGGIIGAATDNCYIHDCESKATIIVDESSANADAEYRLGGIAGVIRKESSISKCVFNGSISATGTMKTCQIAGIVADVDQTTSKISNCVVNVSGFSGAPNTTKLVVQPIQAGYTYDYRTAHTSTTLFEFGEEISRAFCIETTTIITDYVTDVYYGTVTRQETAEVKIDVKNCYYTGSSGLNFCSVINIGVKNNGEELDGAISG